MLSALGTKLVLCVFTSEAHQGFRRKALEEKELRLGGIQSGWELVGEHSCKGVPELAIGSSERGLQCVTRGFNSVFFLFKFIFNLFYVYGYFT